MAGCDTQNFPGQGDRSWSVKRLATWFGVGAGIGGVLAFLNLASALAGVALTGGAALAAFGAIVFAAAAVGVVSMFIGYGVEWFTRLKVQDPATITIVGWALCTGRNLCNPGPPAFCDGDWTFNLAPHLETPPTPTVTWAVTSPGGLTMDDVRTRVASGAEFAGKVGDPAHGMIDILHTEITSHIGDYAAVGGAIGAPVGAAAGIIAGIAICAALGIATFGIGLAVCALIVALAALIGAAAGGAIGQWIGGGIGAIADAIDDPSEAGDAISEGCFVSVTGRWVTDRSHQHNEIHDISSASVIDCGIGAAGSPLTVAGAVGIGRHPTGPDP